MPGVRREFCAGESSGRSSSRARGKDARVPGMREEVQSSRQHESTSATAFRREEDQRGRQTESYVQQ